jgi:Amt family ammonium transporter
MNTIGKKMSLFKKVDDCLGVFHTHAVAGVIGGFMVGILATVEGSAAFGLTNPGGAIDGNGRQVWVQIVGALFIIGWNTVWTSLILLFIKFVLRVPLRMSEADLLIGDDAIHGEEAYVFFDEVGPSMSHNHDLELGHSGIAVTDVDGITKSPTSQKVEPY